MIHVEGKWYIDIDKWSYTLQKYAGKKTDKNGVEVDQWTDQKYYGTLNGCIIGYYGIKAKEILMNKDMELYEALDTLNKYYQTIDDKLSEIMRNNK